MCSGIVSRAAENNASINLRGAAKPSLRHHQAPLHHARILREERDAAVRARGVEPGGAARAVRRGRSALHFHVGPRFPTRLSQAVDDSNAVPAGSDHGADGHSDAGGGGGLREGAGDAERGEVPESRGMKEGVTRRRSIGPISAMKS